MKSRNINLDLEETSAKIFYHRIYGEDVKTMVVFFSQPRNALSTRSGFKRVKAVVNSYAPSQLFEKLSKGGVCEGGVKKYENHIVAELNLPRETFILSTARDIDTFITATEAKVIALEEMDIRSVYSKEKATGTGTDQIVVVSGKGPKISYTGSHAKAGELIAKAITSATKNAIINYQQFIK